MCPLLLRGGFVKRASTGAVAQYGGNHSEQVSEDHSVYAAAPNSNHGQLEQLCI